MKICTDECLHKINDIVVAQKEISNELLRIMEDIKKLSFAPAKKKWFHFSDKKEV